MNHIEICNRALSSIGANPLEHKDAPGDHIVLDAYADVVESTLSGYPWSFCRKVKQLAAYEKPPLIHWKTSWQLPPDRLENPQAYFASRDDVVSYQPVKAFELMGDSVLCDESALWARYKFRAEPHYWPSYFVSLIIKMIACRLALSIMENQGRYKMLYQEIYGTPRDAGQGGELASCQNRDAQNQAAEFFVAEPGPLEQARY